MYMYGPLPPLPLPILDIACKQYNFPIQYTRVIVSLGFAQAYINFLEELIVQDGHLLSQIIGSKVHQSLSPNERETQTITLAPSFLVRLKLTLFFLNLSWSLLE